MKAMPFPIIPKPATKERANYLFGETPFIVAEQEGLTLCNLFINDYDDPDTFINVGPDTFINVVLSADVLCPPDREPCPAVWDSINQEWDIF